MWTYIILFIIGAFIGSFLNVVIIRLPERRSIFRERSACMKCKAILKPLDLIPILSFFILKGRCRSCKESISWQYPIIEFLSGAVFVFVGYYHNVLDGLANPIFYRDLVFVMALLLLFTSDLKFGKIFDAITLPMIVFAFIVNIFLFSTSENYLDVVLYLLLSGLVCAAFFGLQYLASKGAWLGAGDVKLGTMIGFMLGWPMVISCVVLAYIMGAFASIILLFFKKKRLSSKIPFGTFLCLSTFVILFWGTELTDWIINLF